MYHPIPREWLELTNRIDVVFDNGTNTKSRSGSGFFLNDESGTAVFITNRHMVDLSYKNPDEEDCRPSEYRPSRLTIFSNTGDRDPVVDLKGDVDVEIAVHPNIGVDIAVLMPWIRDQKATPRTFPASKFLADQSYFEHLPWGAQVTFSSFQAWRDNLTKKPILRTGIVSSDPRDDYSSDLVDRKSALLIEAFSFEGSSGSPLFANAFGIPVDAMLFSGGPGYCEPRIIGIMCGHFRKEDKANQRFMHAGLSYCHKSTLLTEMLSQLGSLERLSVVEPSAQ